MTLSKDGQQLDIETFLRGLQYHLSFAGSSVLFLEAHNLFRNPKTDGIIANADFGRTSRIRSRHAPTTGLAGADYGFKNLQRSI